MLTASIFRLVAPRTSNDIGFPGDWQLIFYFSHTPGFALQGEIFHMKPHACLLKLHQAALRGHWNTIGDGSPKCAEKLLCGEMNTELHAHPCDSTDLSHLSQASGRTVSCSITRTQETVIQAFAKPGSGMRHQVGNEHVLITSFPVLG